MTKTQQDAWEQILSIAQNAGLEDVEAMADCYLARGGHAHVLTRLGISVAPPLPASPGDEERLADPAPPAPPAGPPADPPPAGSEGAHPDADLHG